MIFSVSGRQPESILKQTDEIKIRYNDFNILYDYEIDYPDKRIVISIPKEKDKDVDWLMLAAWTEKLNITLALYDITDSDKANENNIPWFWAYEVTTWPEFESLIALGASQILLGEPLFFDLEEVNIKRANRNILIRKIANVAYNSYLPRANGIKGAYLRPEDLRVYSRFIDIIEFEPRDLEEERTLLKIYKEEKWNGNLNFLIKNLNYNIDNRGISEQFAERRQTCRQICYRNGHCHNCETEFALVTAIDRNQEWLASQL